MSPLREAGLGALARNAVFQQQRNPFFGVAGPQNTQASVARAGGLLAGKGPAAATVCPVRPRERWGLRRASPFTGTTGKRRQPGSSQHPSQNRGFCWASKREKNTPAP